MSEATHDLPVEHPYYQPQPGTAWAHVDEWSGVLPPGRPLITLANWQEAPNHHWAFQHMRELMPSHVIDGTDAPRPLAERPQTLGAVSVTQPSTSVSADR